MSNRLQIRSKLWRIGAAFALLLHPPVAHGSDLPSAVEMVDRFADTTQTLRDGLAYYSASGTLLVVIKDQLSVGNWTTADGGQLCWVLRDRTEPFCETYARLSGDLHVLRDGGVTQPAELTAGNVLQERANAEALAASVTLLSREETLALVTGHTALRSEVGRMYYAPDFTLKTVWNGVQKSGLWSVDAQGGVCWKIVG
ncbi:MAG: hypothetical protein AAGH74_16965 [Pseudomonadota bacterium]